VVFNIKGNDYRLVVAIDVEKAIVWIKWIGTHAEYDRINVRTVAHEGRQANPDRAGLRGGDGRDRAAVGGEGGDARGRPAGGIGDARGCLRGEHYPMDPPDPVEAIKSGSSSWA
jgi:hypothetical protein